MGLSWKYGIIMEIMDDHGNNWIIVEIMGLSWKYGIIMEIMDDHGNNWIIVE